MNLDYIKERTPQWRHYLPRQHCQKAEEETAAGNRFNRLWAVLDTLLQKFAQKLHWYTLSYHDVCKTAANSPDHARHTLLDTLGHRFINLCSQSTSQ